MSTKSDLDLQAQLAYITHKHSLSDTVTWILRNIGLPNKRKWEFADRRWQLQIFDDKSPKQAHKKSAQVGITTTELLWILHWLNYNSGTAMYTLPRRDDITDFTKLVLDPIIENSPQLKSIIADSDSTRLKAFHAQHIDASGEIQSVQSFFHLMESSVDPRMIPVDILANDEIDKSDPDKLDQFIARLDQSSSPHHFQYSTPTVPGFGIDRIYEESTKNEWMVRCQICSSDQVLDWDKNFVAEPTPKYICASCHNDMPSEAIVHGLWVPMQPGREVVGYHVSHMMMPISRPVAKLYAELAGKRITKKNFYNLRLGMAFASASGQFSKEMLRAKCFESKHPREYTPMTDKPYYMGVDQGNEVHLMIARKEGKTLKIIHAEKIPEKSDKAWNDRVIQLIRLFHIRFCVVDGLPNTHDAREIWSEFKGGNRVGLCYYPEQEEPIKYERDTGKVCVSKTEMLDGLRDEVSDGEWQLWGTPAGNDPIIETIMDHISNLKRDERENNAGIIKGVWVNTGPDHFGHAWNYLRIATLLGGGARYDIRSLDEMPESMETPMTTEEKTLFAVWPSLKGDRIEIPDEN